MMEIALLADLATLPECGYRGRIRPSGDCFCVHEDIGRGAPIPLSLCKVCPMLGSAAPRPLPMKHPGTVLSQMLAKKFGEYAQVDCPCSRHIDEMNWRGLEWCEHNVDVIVGWLLDQARARYKWLRIVPSLASRVYLRSIVSKALSTCRTHNELLQRQRDNGLAGSAGPAQAGAV